MTLVPGDRVHLSRLGTGIVRESRGEGRYAVEIKGRIVIAAAADLERVDTTSPTRPRRRREDPAHDAPLVPRSARQNGPSLDLHGMTAAESVEAVKEFVNEALVAGHADVRVIHGRSGGRLKSAVHACLRELPVVRSFRVSPENPGVTIITFR